MKSTEYVIALTCAFLKAPKTKFHSLFNHFNSLFGLDELRKIEMISIGGQLDSGLECTFSEWITSVRNEKIRSWQVYHNYQNQLEIPPSIAAAFADGHFYIVEIQTETIKKYYTIQASSSSPYLLSREQFYELIESQKNTDEIWKLINSLLNEANELNFKEKVLPGKEMNYFSTKEGEVVFDLILPTFIEEIQIENIVSENAFIMPKSLTDKFYKVDPAIENYTESIFLYPENQVSAKELIELVNAQSFSRNVWEECEKEFSHFPQPETPHLPASQYEKFVLTQTPEQLANGMNGIVCRIICDLCEVHGTKPVIPSDLKASFGPNETEYKKAQARSNPNNEKWLLKENEVNWELYFFKKLAISADETTSEFKTQKKEFKLRVQEILDYGILNEFPFQEAFLMSDFFLHIPKIEGDFDEIHFEAIAEELMKVGFSEMAIEIFHNHSFYLTEWHKMGYNKEKVFTLFALSNADVFGVAANWYNQLSEEEITFIEGLFLKTEVVMKNLFVALVSKN